MHRGRGQQNRRFDRRFDIRTSNKDSNVSNKEERTMNDFRGQTNKGYYQNSFQRTPNKEQAHWYQKKQVEFENTRNILGNMLSDDFTEDLSIKLTESNEDIEALLNDIPSLDIMLSKTIIKVLLKASIDHKLESKFREFLTMTLGTKFAQWKIDSLVSVYLPENADSDMFDLLVAFLKLSFELMPGLAYDMYYYRVENLRLLLEVPHFKATIIDDRLIELQELKMLVDDNSTDKVEKAEKKDLGSFRGINIFPTTIDLLETNSKDVDLRKNRTLGAYDSVDDYLDVQFRLMHEDFIQPLREGLNEYKSDNGRRSFNIRVYKNVRLLHSAPYRRLGIIRYVLLNKAHLKHIKWSQSKRLLYGSLICFSSDNFATIFFATVANRDENDIKDGIIAVKFMDQVPFDDKEYTMIETMNMYESYKHVLAKIQNTNEDNLCMKKYLVFAETEISLPKYVTTDTLYRLDDCRIRPGKINRRWPDADKLQLNESQFLAFKSALTKELTIIQGPPGTGKTYLGLKICSCLIQNCDGDFGPILIVCYTNHALDQFLEGITQFTKEIVRIGGQCKSEKMKEFSIYKQKEKIGFKEYRSLKTDLHELLTSIEDKLRDMNNAFTSILNINKLRLFIPEKHYLYLEKLGIEKWLSGLSIDDIRTDLDDIREIIVEEIIYKEILQNLEDVVRDIVIPQCHLPDEDNEINEDSESDEDNEYNYIKNQRLLDSDQHEVSQLTLKFSEMWSVVPSRKNATKKIKANIKKKSLAGSFALMSMMSKEEVYNVDCLDKLSMENRWRLYQYWRLKYLNYLRESSANNERYYERISKLLNELQFKEEKEVMKSMKIIGMTTTGAARYSSVLEEIRCKIIIVEEAAEVLESHIIGALNKGCQHLILIGDHKQLRPSPAVYELATKYNLDLSMFERLINNKLHFNSLTVQHRMRPEIADIVRFVYDDLQDSQSVTQYPMVPAMNSNIYFFNHWECEELNKDIVSYSNRFEAELVVRFCNHLLKNGVQRTEVTILTLYSGQLFLLNSLMDKKVYKGVRVCVVDNYQGEENKIILLSLVRSNAEERIGFAGIDNRICVSLSRAKHGLYVFGNFDLLASKSKLWDKICTFLKEKCMLGATLNMYCQNHPGKNLIISNAVDFDQYPDGGCEQLCNTMLKCGHICVRYCHFLDQDHTEYQCQYKCTLSCVLGHPCQLKCYEGCSKCRVMVEKVIPGCKHKQNLPCHKEPQANDCMHPCEKILSCEHRCIKYCGELCDQCLTIVKKVSPTCGHDGEYFCSEEKLVCKRECKSLLNCGHQCSGTCSICSTGTLHRRCSINCGYQLICGHSGVKICSEPCYPCQSPCQEACQHQSCRKSCDSVCTPCKSQCGWRCVHDMCRRNCSEPCDRNFCNEKCPNFVDCTNCGIKFQCYSVCGEICRPICAACDGNIKANTKYITLWTCDHYFDVEFMDNYMKTSSDNKEIVRKKCPTCQVFINQRSCFRYLKVIKDTIKDIKEVQRIIRNKNCEFTFQYYSNILNSVKRGVFRMFELLELSNYFVFENGGDWLQDKYFRCPDSSNDILVYKFATSLILLNELRKCNSRSISELPFFVRRNQKQSIIDIVRWLRPDDRKFDQFEINDCMEEFDRINSAFKSTERIYSSFSIRRFSMNNDFDKSKLLSQIKNEFFYLSNVRWFKCRSGHVYNNKYNDDNECSKCASI